MNRREAIRQRCIDCAGSPAAVRQCDFEWCPLHSFRMPREKQDAKKRTKAISRYGLECGGGSRYEVTRCPATSCPLWQYRPGEKSAIVRPDCTHRAGFSDQNPEAGVRVPGDVVESQSGARAA